MKFGHILVYHITRFATCFWLNFGDWKLVLGPFMILMKLYNKTCQFLVIDIYHAQFSFNYPFKKIEHLKLNQIGCGVIGAGC